MFITERLFFFFFLGSILEGPAGFVVTVVIAVMSDNKNYDNKNDKELCESYIVTITAIIRSMNE